MNLKSTGRLLAVCLVGTFSGSVFAAVEAPYEVGTWENFCTGAVSHTFDDNMNTKPTAPEQKLYDDKKFHMTMCVQTGTCDWNNCKASFAKGHEVSSHTVSHSSSTDAFEKSQQAIKQNVPGEKCVTVAYPDCQQNGANTLKYFLAGRNCTGSPVNATTPTKWDQINSQMFGSGQGNYDNTTNGLNNYAEQAFKAKGWSVYCFHGIGSQTHNWATISLTAITGHIDYLDKNRDRIWIETFGNVARYIQERNAASVAKKDSTDKGITITVTDNLPDSIFNYPLTIQRPLPNGWTTAAVAQKGQPVDDSVLTVDSKPYIRFKAVPDGGDVLISQIPVAVSQSSNRFSTGASPVVRQQSALLINPASFNESGVTATLFDLTGKVLARYTVKAGESRVALPDGKISRSAFVAKISGGGNTWSGMLMPQM